MSRFRFPSHWTVEERLAHFGRAAPNGCIIWTGTRNVHGYGQLYLKRKQIFAHRVAWISAKGPIPSATPCVLHKCDTPACINVDHLFLGTPADNTADMIAKGRARRGHLMGEAHGQAVLSANQVRAIRKDTRPQRRIAEDYEVSISTVGHIKARRRWASLGEQP